MREIVKVEKINNLLTIDIKGSLLKTRIGDIFTDNIGNSFRLDSIALSGHARRDTTTLVVTRIHKKTVFGQYINAE